MSDQHKNGIAGPAGTHTPSWMVVRDGFEGKGYATFGPMPREDGDRMVASPYGGHVVCSTCERQSPCSAVGHVL